MRRRALLWAPLALQAGCGREAEPAWPDDEPAVALPPRPAYRHQQAQLFQRVKAKIAPSRVEPGAPLELDGCGPTAEYVDSFVGWPWDHVGGDWLDADGIRQGPKPWAQLRLLPGAARTEFLDVGRLLRRVQAEPGRWCVLLLRSSGALPRVASPFTPQAGPELRIEYADGRKQRLPCRLMAAVDTSSQAPNTTAPQHKLPVFLEFDRPEAEVRSAQLSLGVQELAAESRLELLLLDPPLPRAQVEQGIAARAAPLDAGLDREPALIGQQRYLDGSKLDDFLLPERVNPTSEHTFDPRLWDPQAAAELDKLPHRGAGRWVSGADLDGLWSLVGSGHRGDGFAPLAPGMGALRLAMPAPKGLKDGAVVGYGGSSSGSAHLFMPEDLLGRLDRIFVRYYLRLGVPRPVDAMADPRHRYQVFQSESRTRAVWLDRGGKFGITPEHLTSTGGVSGSSGGGHGWQMRLAWQECDAGLGGPDEGGWRPGFHLYDFAERQPPGHRYGSDRRHQLYWGQRGGLGGMLYQGRWYCIEHELKLNSVSEQAPGWRADGELRAWLDGQLVFERRGLVFRSLPLHDPGPQKSRIRPCRELGVRALWLNLFHGGQTPTGFDRSLYLSGLAWAREYIGPMRLD